MWCSACCSLFSILCHVMSVCLFMYCVKTGTLYPQCFWPPGSFTILVVPYQTLRQNFQWGSPNATSIARVMKKLWFVSVQNCVCGADNVAWSKLKISKIQDGGWPPFLKSLYRHMSVKNHLISMTFCTQQQILNRMNVTWSKWKSCIGHTSSSTERISCWPMYYFFLEMKQDRAIVRRSYYGTLIGTRMWSIA